MSTWILLRGLMRDQRHWEDFPERLRGALPAARVVALDLPGNGTLNGEPSPLRIEDTAAWCSAALARRGLAPPYHLLAISLGAMVAIAWAAARPTEVAGCVLINTSVRPFSTAHRRFGPAGLKAFARLLRPGRSDIERERIILGLTSNRPLDPVLLARWAAWHHQRPVARRNALRQLFAAARYRAPLARPPTDVLVLASTRDRLVDVRCSRALAARWRCPLVEHPDAGHDLPLDAPDWIVREVARWLATNSR